MVVVEGNGFSNIQNAIDNILPGGVIYLKNITYINDFQHQMVIDKPVTIIGEDGTVLDAGELSRIFNINNNVDNVFLGNIAFINGLTDGNGGAINVGGGCDNLHIDNCTFANNTANAIGEYYGGGAIYIGPNCNNGKITNSNFTENIANTGGGAVNIESGNGWTFDNCTFTDNLARGLSKNLVSEYENGGGAIWSCRSEVFIINSTFERNEAPYGGALRGKMNTEDSAFYDNVATDGNGGAIDVTIQGSSDRPDLYYKNTIFVNNTAKGNRSDERAQGGALHMFFINHVDIIGCECYNNTADRGGAIDLFIIGTAQVDNCIIENNTATSEGGGLYINTTSTPTEFRDSIISNNVAGTDGGAICLVANGAVFDNVTTNYNNASRGGSSYIEGNNTLITNSTLDGNYASGNGGGFYIEGDNCTVIDVDVSDNCAEGSGGAIYVIGDDASFTDVNSIHNIAENGGSTYIEGNNAIIRNSTFDINYASNNGGGLYVAGDNCNVSDVDVSNNYATGNGGAIYILSNSASFTDVYSFAACHLLEKG